MIHPEHAKKLIAEVKSEDDKQPPPAAPKPPRLSLLEREALRLAKATATHERNVARSKARMKAEQIRKAIMACDDNAALTLARELVAMLDGGPIDASFDEAERG